MTVRHKALPSEGERIGALYRLADVTFAAGGAQILPSTSLEIGAGRMVAIIGPNGSGKSSLLKLLARQQTPSSGSISLLGRELGHYGDREFARTVAYMPQFTPPADGMTVEELVMLGRFPWHGALGRTTENDRGKVRQALERTDLLRFRERLVDSLSGGERQRCWLAMMLAQDPQCLLLDEPTSALDLAHQAEMLALAHALTRDGDLSAVVIMHDINMAARYCDEIIALKGGRIVARGSPDQIIRPAMLGDVYDLPMGVLSHPVTGQPIGYVI